MTKKEFLRLVDYYSDTDESVLGDLLNIVTAKYNRMVERERGRRDSTHKEAVIDLLDAIWNEYIFRKAKPELFGCELCALLLNGLSELCPSCEGGTIAREQLLKHFADSVRALGWEPSDEFIKDVRKKSDWLELLYKKF